MKKTVPKNKLSLWGENYHHLPAAAVVPDGVSERALDVRSYQAVAFPLWKGSAIMLCQGNGGFTMHRAARGKRRQAFEKGSKLLILNWLR
jgi:hypothetical protein